MVSLITLGVHPQEKSSQLYLLFEFMQVDKTNDEFTMKVGTMITMDIM